METEACVNFLILTLTYLVPVMAAVGVGWYIGHGRGHDVGYQQGYHDGQFDEKMGTFGGRR
jgi:hypothetical protein